MLLRRIADARVFNCEDDRGRLGVKSLQLVIFFNAFIINIFLQKDDSLSGKSISSSSIAKRS